MNYLSSYWQLPLRMRSKNEQVTAATAPIRVFDTQVNEIRNKHSFTNTHFGNRINMASQILETTVKISNAGAGYSPQSTAFEHTSMG